MQLLEASETTTSPSYWLNWRVFLCSLLIVISVFIAFILLWKNEYYSGDEEDNSTSDSRVECWHIWFNEAWRPCVKEVNPIWLMAFRLVSFVLLLAALTSDFVVYGSSLLFYYTQWTLTLVTIYFGIGSVLSIYGCYLYSKGINNFNGVTWMDEKQGLDTPLMGTGYSDGIKRHDYPNTQFVRKSAGLCGYLFQVLFQMTAGAVLLTDIVYWFFIFPALEDHDVPFLTVAAHSINILLLGDATLNCLPFPWFRIAYFVFWTAAYVIFQWLVHACESIWWPYPFLDLSSAYAPLWYLLVAMMHIPSYGLVVLLVGVKKSVLSRWFPSHVTFSDQILSSCQSSC